MSKIYIREKIGVDDLFDLDLEAHGHISFGGYLTMQTHSALFILEQVLVSNPDVTRIVEVGTAYGGLALFFGLHMSSRNGKVLTLDISRELLTDEWRRLAGLLNIEFRQRNSQNEATVNEVNEFIQSGRALIFIDAGDKLNEFALYVPHAKKNDLVMMHDYAPEIHSDKLKPETLSLLEPFRQEEFDALKTRILSMKRK